jgi:hypothetical protein
MGAVLRPVVGAVTWSAAAASHDLTDTDCYDTARDDFEFTGDVPRAASAAPKDVHASAALATATLGHEAASILLDEYVL